jgi:hypothetical protein
MLYRLDISHSPCLTPFYFEQKKILVDAEASPVISGYGIFKVLYRPDSLSPRFSSPESFSSDVAYADRTQAGDVYAFSMVALEVSLINVSLPCLMLIFRLCPGFNPTMICPMTTL